MISKPGAATCPRPDSSSSLTSIVLPACHARSSPGSRASGGVAAEGPCGENVTRTARNPHLDPAPLKWDTLGAYHIRIRRQVNDSASGLAAWHNKGRDADEKAT